MKLSLLVSSAAVACSPEGQAIADGLVWFYTRVAWTIIAVLAIAVISGAIIGYRKRAIVRQVAWHLLWGVVVLIVGAAAGMMAFQIWESLRIAEGEREIAITEAWMAPLANPPAGELDRALAACASWSWRRRWLRSAQVSSPSDHSKAKSRFKCSLMRRTSHACSSSLSDLGVRKRNGGRARTDFDDFDAPIGNR